MNISSNIIFLQQKDIFFQIFDHLNRFNLSKLELTSKLFYTHVQSYIPHYLARFPYKLKLYTGNNRESFERFFNTLTKPSCIKYFCSVNQTIGKTLGDTSILRWIADMPHLKEVDLHHTQITAKTIQGLATLSFLEELNLNQCTFISQLGFYQNIGKLTHLTSLKMKNNPAITENALKEINEKLKKLKYLDLRGTQTFYSPSVELLKERGVTIKEDSILPTLISEFATYKLVWLPQ